MPCVLTVLEKAVISFMRQYAIILIFRKRWLKKGIGMNAMIMKRLCVAMVATGLVGCSSLANPPSGLTETQESLMTECRMLGMVAETADAANLSTYLAQRNMVQKIERRALQLRATHIVWLHGTPDSAAAKAYRCE
ncbi:MAG: hypothetical protein VR64_23160 [Desulfatitalea sp. BRH_c12]|nr:MAG: hypothetical protein VR64_23160 [Desulfatitalea sp. BRH_c12]